MSSNYRYHYHHYDSSSQSLSFTAKRGREDEDEETTPKKNKVSLPRVPPPRVILTEPSQQTLTGLAHSLLTPPPKCPMDDADMDLGGDVEMGSADEGASSSNPLHPWTPAPRLLHHDSNTSLSSSYAASSLPGTPLDFPEQYGQLSSHPSYPSASNPTSFTDQNGVSHVFAAAALPHSVPGPLSVYAPTSAYGLDEASAFASYALQHGHKSATGTIEIQQPGSTMRGDG